MQYVLSNCSDQNLTTLQDCDTCPTALGVSQVDKELEMLVGSCFNPEMKALGLTPSSHSTPRREPRPCPGLTFVPEERTSGSAHIRP